MSMIRSLTSTRFPTVCFGCGERFPVRAGQTQALVGHDARLYCYDGQPECLERALGVHAKKAA
jgi:hypothetical protein